MVNEQAKKFIEGDVLLFDKPYKWSSFDVVNKVRSMMKYVLGIKKLKVGHAGTLDPLATGLLVICTGSKTKSIEGFQEMEKEYTGTFYLGSTTPSFDLETQADEHFTILHVTPQMIYSAAQDLTGNYEQMPPQFSAKKIAGERAYDFARRGEVANLKPKKIEITEFEISRIQLPEIDFRIVCSKGTYIRSIARDLGEALEAGAHLTSLRRTRVGNLSVNNAWNLPDFENHLRSIGNLEISD
jgi:tRNA pseudouridine55 synthase